MPHGFDNTWGIVKDSSLVPSVFCFWLFVIYLLSALMLSFFLFQPVFARS